jgi:hypothetical protein
MSVVAEHRLDVLYPDGQMVPVLIRVGLPRPHPQGDYVCSVEAHGMRIWQGPSELSGVGSFHALMIGIRFLYKMLSSEVEQGAILHWEGGKQFLNLDELFVLHKIV